MAKVVETARFRPGKCAISGETTGPFIDTGHTVPRYGRVYLSPRWLEEPMDALGWIAPERAEELKAEVEALREENARLEDVEADHQELIEAVSKYLPEPEAQVFERKVVEPRDPSDEEIANWIKKYGANHSVVRGAQAPEKGSYEEWSALYGPTGPQPSVAPVEDEPETEDAEETEQVDEGPNKFVELHGQQVDLDLVLDQNVGDVLTYAKGKDEDFVEALVAREYYREGLKDRDPRSTLLDGLGYEVDDEGDEITIEETD